MNNEVCIYGLVDPRDRQIKYVGQTTDMQRRLKQHAADSGSTLKQEWVTELRDWGVAPEMVLLDTVSKEDAHKVENWWILFCRYKGWQNVNGTSPSEWRADFGEMFSENLERQYQEFVAQLESAEADAIENAASYVSGIWKARILYFAITTCAYFGLILDTAPTDEIDQLFVIVFVIKAISLFALEKICPGYMDELGASLERSGRILRGEKS